MEIEKEILLFTGYVLCIILYDVLDDNSRLEESGKRMVKKRDTTSNL